MPLNQNAFFNKFLVEYSANQFLSNILSFQFSERIFIDYIIHESSEILLRIASAKYQTFLS